MNLKKWFVLDRYPVGFRRIYSPYRGNPFSFENFKFDEATELKTLY